MHYHIKVDEYEPQGPVLCQAPGCGNVCEGDDHSYTILHKDGMYTLCEDCIHDALLDIVEEIETENQEQESDEETV